MMRNAITNACLAHTDHFDLKLLLKKHRKSDAYLKDQMMVRGNIVPLFLPFD